MKPVNILALLACQVIGINSMPATSEAVAQSEAELEAECGALGVYKPDLDSLPDYVDRTKIRKCAGHPASLTRQVDVEQASGKRNEVPDTLTKRGECWYGKTWGCTDGYCWKTCNKGKGTWCWMAFNYGKGDWMGCSKGADDPYCKPFSGNGYTVDCGKKGGKADCTQCGCGCW